MISNTLYSRLHTTNQQFTSLDATISSYNASFIIISSTFSLLSCFLLLFVYFSFLTSDTCYKPCGSFPTLSLSFTHFSPSLQLSPQPSAIILCLDYNVQLFLVSLPPVSSSNLFWTSQTKQFPKINFSEYTFPCLRIKWPNQLTHTSPVQVFCCYFFPIDFSTIYHVSDFTTSSVPLLKCSPCEDTLGKRAFHIYAFKYTLQWRLPNLAMLWNHWERFEMTQYRSPALQVLIG